MGGNEMRPAARLLLIERDAILPILERTPPAALDLPTVCTGWSVRDVLAHCGAALTAAASGSLHGFTPQDNERDVEERRSWPLDRVVDELRSGYRAGAGAIDRAGGSLDGIGLGEWVHGGDIREAIGEDDAYASAGSDLAVGLLVERSRLRGLPAVRVTLPTGQFVLGMESEGAPSATLEADVESFVRLCSGRPAEPSAYRANGIGIETLRMFR